MKNKIIYFFVVFGLLIIQFFCGNTVYAAGNQALVIGRAYTDGLSTAADVNAITFQLKNLTSYTVLNNAAPTYNWLTGKNGNYKRMESDILVFAGHSYSSGMDFCNNANNNKFWILAGYNDSSGSCPVIGLKSYDMSKVKFAFFAGCETAKGTSNITKSAYSLGVKATLGWKEEIASASAVEWEKKFFTKLPAFGTTMTAALDYADSFIYSDSRVKNWQKYGKWTSQFSQLSLGDLDSYSTTYVSSEQLIGRKNFSFKNIDTSNLSNDKIIEIIYNLIKNNINYSFESFQYSISSIERSDKKIFDLKFDDDLTIGYTAFVYDNSITIYDNF